jgi:hypothetical protein
MNEQPSAANEEHKVSEPSRQARQRIVDALATKRSPSTGLSPCALCGVRNWGIGHYVPLPYSLTPNQFNSFPGPVYPLVAVICGNCGNTLFLNLRVLGFTADDWASLKVDPMPNV